MEEKEFIVFADLIITATNEQEAMEKAKKLLIDDLIIVEITQTGVAS